MTHHGVGALLCVLTLLLVLAAGYCFYRSTEAGITAEEGLKYSLPAIRASTVYTAKQVQHVEAAFRDLDRNAARWGNGTVVLLFFGTFSGIAGYLLLNQKCPRLTHETSSSTVAQF